MSAALLWEKRLLWSRLSPGFGFQGWGFEFLVLGSGFMVHGSGLGVWGWGLECRIEDLGSRVSVFLVPGFGVGTSRLGSRVLFGVKGVGFRG